MAGIEKNESSNVGIADIEKAIKENADVVMAFMKLLEKLKGAGIVDALTSINENVIPDNLDFFAKAFTSKDSMETFARSGNTLFALLFMLSNRKMADVVKAIAFNSQGIAESMEDGASKPQALSALKLLAMLKDPEVSSGINAMMNGLKVLGSILQKLD